MLVLREVDGFSLLLHRASNISQKGFQISLALTFDQPDAQIRPNSRQKCRIHAVLELVSRALSKYRVADVDWIDNGLLKIFSAASCLLVLRKRITGR